VTRKRDNKDEKTNLEVVSLCMNDMFQQNFKNNIISINNSLCQSINI